MPLFMVERIPRDSPWDIELEDDTVVEVRHDQTLKTTPTGRQDGHRRVEVVPSAIACMGIGVVWGSLRRGDIVRVMLTPRYEVRTGEL